jgi:hypothetical protein
MVFEGWWKKVLSHFVLDDVLFGILFGDFGVVWRLFLIVKSRFTLKLLFCVGTQPLLLLRVRKAVLNIREIGHFMLIDNLGALCFSCLHFVVLALSLLTFVYFGVNVWRISDFYCSTLPVFWMVVRLKCL